MIHRFATALIGIAGGLVLFASLDSLQACAKSTTGVPQAADLAVYADEQVLCVEQADARAQAHDCRMLSRLRFCARFPDLPSCADGGL